MLTDTSSLVLGDFNAHHSVLYSGTTDTIDNHLADSVSISSFTVLNTDTPTMLPGNANPSSPDVSVASASLITSSEWQTHTTMSSDHLPILIGTDMTYHFWCPSRIIVVIFIVKLLHIWYAMADNPGQEGLLRWGHHSLGFWTKVPIVGVHDQHLPERGRHLSEGKLSFDLCTEVNSNALHPGQTPVPYVSQYYSWRHTATIGAHP